jgi:hypothetical protein
VDRNRSPKIKVLNSTYPGGEPSLVILTLVAVFNRRGARVLEQFQSSKILAWGVACLRQAQPFNAMILTEIGIWNARSASIVQHIIYESKLQGLYIGTVT